MAAKGKFKDKLMEDLAKRVEEMVSSEDWMEMLETMSRFRKYSFRNIMLIMVGKPGAMYVAGYRKWEEMNRRPTRGSAIWITGFNSGTKDKVDPETGEKTGEKETWVSFPPVKVFDYSDTYVIDPEKPDPVGDLMARQVPIYEQEGDEKLYNSLVKFNEDRGWTVEVDNSGVADGYTTLDGSKKIIISSRITGLQALEALIHETAHSLLHADEDGNNYNDGLDEEYGSNNHRGIREVEAESTTFTVLRYLGIESSTHSIDYIAHWSKGDIDTVISVGTRVGSARTKIIEGIVKE